MKQIPLKALNLVLIGLTGLSLFYLISNSQKIFSGQTVKSKTKTQAATFQRIYAVPKVQIAAIPIKREKPAEKEIRGLYLTFWSASSAKKIDNILNSVKGTQINALVIDIKDFSGQIAYDSQVPLVLQLQTSRNYIKNIGELISHLHEQGIYVIARQTIFQDPELAHKRPEWAVKNSATGGLWLDKKGLAWMDPTQKDVWNYNLQIAQEAADLGFDEINFDYVRFPSDGNMKTMAFAGLGEKKKSAVIAEFFQYMSENLQSKPVYLSADLFGLTTERTDDMNIGQQIEDAALYFDYVCPMVYPSHYPAGYLNYQNPASHPYEVVKNALTKGEESIKATANARAKIRPWLQAFNLGAIYTPAMIDLQIKAAKEAGTYGYLLWNASNIYGYLPD